MAVGDRGRVGVRPQANPCPDSQWCLKQLEFADLEVSATRSEPVAPGGTYEVAAVFKNHAAFIDITDPDRCNNDANLCQSQGLLASPGYCTLTKIFPPGDGISNQEARQCINMDEFFPPEIERVFFRVPAPTQTGAHDISAIAMFEGSSQATSGRSATVFVEEGGDQDSGFDGESATDTVASYFPWAAAGGLVGLGLAGPTNLRGTTAGLVGAGVGVGTKAWLDESGTHISTPVLIGAALLGVGVYAYTNRGGLPDRESLEALRSGQSI